MRRGASARSRGDLRATHRARMRRARTERARAWSGRKAAFGAMGRLQARHAVHGRHDPAPRARRRAGARSRQMSEHYRLGCCNVFHAGDGNLHPLIVFDVMAPGELERAEAFGADILKLCVAVGGVLTGEHGVGVEKKALMGEMFSDTDLEAAGAAEMRLRRKQPAQSGQGVSDAARLRRAGPYACAWRAHAVRQSSADVIATPMTRHAKSSSRGARRRSPTRCGRRSTTRRRSRSSPAAASATMAGRCRRSGFSMSARSPASSNTSRRNWCSPRAPRRRSRRSRRRSPRRKQMLGFRAGRLGRAVRRRSRPRHARRHRGDERVRRAPRQSGRGARSRHRLPLRQRRGRGDQGRRHA